MTKKMALGILCCVMMQATGLALTVDDEFSIMRGQVLKIPLTQITRVSMYEEGILDVIEATAQGLEVIGASAGETIVEVQTRNAKKLFRVSVVDKDTDQLIKRIKKTLYSHFSAGDVVVSQNPLTSRVILSGELPETELEKINVLLGPYAGEVDNFVKKQESEDIVEIDIEIVEVTKDGSQTLGIKWPSQFKYGEEEYFDEDGSVTNTPGSSTFRPFFNVLAGTQMRSPLGATIDFLVSNGKAEILSNPKLACVSGKEASLQIGGSTPVLTTADEGGTSVEYQEFGIGLTVAPVVRTDGLIEINLDVEVSDVGERLTIGGVDSPTASAPTTSTRNTSTVVLMKDRETLAISGLMKKKSSETIRKLPWLAEVPVLGTFFKHSSKTTAGDIELVVLMTPRVKKIDKPKKEIHDYTKQIQVLSRDSEDNSAAAPIGEYSHKVRAKILSALEYPEEARRAGWQATVKISVHLSSDGYLLGVKMVQPSGYKTFDDRLMSTIQGIRSYPPFSQDMTEKELWLDIPFVFELN